MFRRIFQTLCVALIVLSGPPVLSQAEQGALEPSYTTYCSPTEPGNSVVEIRWAIGQTVASKNEMEQLVHQHNIDVTVYKNGFQKGLYKTVQSLAPGKRFLAPANEKKPEHEMPGMKDLKVTKIATSKDQARTELRLHEIGPAAGHESIVTRFDGLQPGLRYFWRIQGPGMAARTVSFTAETCPVDSAEREKH